MEKKNILGKTESTVSVSVIIPVYNMERHLSECLDSVLSQSLKNIEVICIDDGSNDRSLSLLGDYCSRYKNVVLLQQNHLGAGAARNYGMSAARGQFVAFMDSDDFYPNKNALLRLYNAAVEHDVLVAGGSFAKYREGKIVETFDEAQKKQRFYSEGFVDFTEFQWCFGFTTYIFNLEFLRKNGTVFPRYKRNEDPPFCAEALSKAKRFYAVPDTVYVARFTDKRIVYDDTLLLDMALGYRDIVSLAVQRKYTVLLGDMLSHLHRMDAYFDASICGGNFRLSHVLAEINELARMFRAREQEEYENFCLEKFSRYKRIVIYGAGKWGRELYDFINEALPNTILEFAATQVASDDYTVRGKPVYALSSLAGQGNDILVVVAVLQEKARQEMLCTAHDLAFENVFAVDRPLVGVSLGNTRGGVRKYSVIGFPSFTYHAAFRKEAA